MPTRPPADPPGPAPAPSAHDEPAKPAVSTEEFWREEGFDFEPTDFGEARRVLDEESITQFDIPIVDSPQHWKRLRRPRRPSDYALTGQGIDWLCSLPDHLRPEALAKQFPRIVNDLAIVWEDPASCQAALDKLLNDGRRGRKGFPRAVHDELVALRNWTQVF